MLPGYFIRPHPGDLSNPSQLPDPYEFYNICFTIMLFDLHVGVLSLFTVCAYCSEGLSQDSSFKAEQGLFLGLWNSTAF